MKIQAAVLSGVDEPFRIETVDLAEPREGEVLVKIAAAGICRSDWHLVTGATRHPLPVVPGHEGAGRVQATGPGVDGLTVDDLVTLNWAPACGACFYCRADKPNLCSTYLEPIWSGTLLDGSTRLSLAGQPLYHYCGLAAFAEYVVVPAASCVKMDARLAPTVAALIGCAVATGVGAVLNTARLPAGSHVAVFGAGGVGLNIILAARLAGADRVIAVDPQPARQALARECGASHVLATVDSAAATIKDLCDSRGADYVFEAVGDPQVQQACIEAARPGGTIVLAGLAPMDSRTEFAAASLSRQEKTVMGSYYGSTVPARDFPLYGQYCLDGKLDLARMISKTYALPQINEAYQDMLAARIARGMIVFD
ncbi:MAG: Zn-dependent alcohol dehydrogenase [Planctomycetota bacterium]|nr:Zn-dependent alcohol dehydrogenase [Planctomycetota bacterium]